MHQLAFTNRSKRLLYPHPRAHRKCRAGTEQTPHSTGWRHAETLPETQGPDTPYTQYTSTRRHCNPAHAFSAQFVRPIYGWPIKPNPPTHSRTSPYPDAENGHASTNRSAARPANSQPALTGPGVSPDQARPSPRTARRHKQRTSAPTHTPRRGFNEARNPPAETSRPRPEQHPKRRSPRRLTGAPAMIRLSVPFQHRTILLRRFSDGGEPRRGHQDPEAPEHRGSGPR